MNARQRKRKRIETYGRSHDAQTRLDGERYGLPMILDDRLAYSVGMRQGHGSTVKVCNNNDTPFGRGDLDELLPAVRRRSE